MTVGLGYSDDSYVLGVEEYGSEIVDGSDGFDGSEGLEGSDGLDGSDGFDGSEGLEGLLVYES
jgi:hypothetical protein